MKAVLAVPTSALGRTPTEADAARARTALTQPGIRRTTLGNTTQLSHVSVSERSRYARELRERIEAALAEHERDDQSGDEQ